MQQENRYPTREQAERIVGNDCPGGCCTEATCDITKWCVPITHFDCGRAMLAMHDEIDKRDDLISDLREYILVGRRMGFYYTDSKFPGEYERIMGERNDAAGTNDNGGVPADGCQQAKTTGETQNNAENESVVVCE